MSFAAMAAEGGVAIRLVLTIVLPEYDGKMPSTWVVKFCLCLFYLLIMVQIAGVNSRPIFFLQASGREAVPLLSHTGFASRPIKSALDCRMPLTYLPFPLSTPLEQRLKTTKLATSSLLMFTNSSNTHVSGPARFVHNGDVYNSGSRTESLDEGMFRTKPWSVVDVSRYLLVLPKVYDYWFLVW